MFTVRYLRVTKSTIKKEVNRADHLPPPGGAQQVLREVLQEQTPSQVTAAPWVFLSQTPSVGQGEGKMGAHDPVEASASVCVSWFLTKKV